MVTRTALYRCWVHTMPPPVMSIKEATSVQEHTSNRGMPTFSSSLTLGRTTDTPVDTNSFVTSLNRRSTTSAEVIELIRRHIIHTENKKRRAKRGTSAL